MRVSRAAPFVAALCALGLNACDDAIAPRQSGAIRVQTTTSGTDLDADGYSIGYNMRAGQDSVRAIQVNASIIVTGVSPGPRLVRISGISPNCTLPSNSVSVTVTVVAADTVDAAFAVECAANVGIITVLPSTIGSDLDLDGYQVSLDGEPPAEVGSAGLTLGSVPAGSHSLTLSGTAANCTAQPATISAIVYFNQTTVARHVVNCRERVGWLQIRATTTGVDTDADGYQVDVASFGSRQLASNGAVTVANIREGSRLVTLSGLSPNCVAVGNNPRLVTIAFNVTTEETFDVTCAAVAKIRVIVNTTGVDPDLSYRVHVEGTNFERNENAPANGSATIAGMGAGNHTVTLEDVAVNCDVSPGSLNPRTVAVMSGTTSDVTFDVVCSTGPWIGFVQWINSSLELFVAKPPGTPATLLTSNSSEENDPSFSPNGAQIVFRSGRDGNSEIYVVNTDGSGLTRLTSNSDGDLNPEWSPDGSRIAFRSDRDGNDEIYVMNADGSNITRLTNHPGFDAKPTWSPDGSKIAFMSDRSGNSQIWVMNSDGSNLTRLTKTAEAAELPAWSPDGSKIAFVRWVSCADYYYNCHNIYVMNADGSGEVHFATLSHDSEPAWSPDSRWIVFETRNCDYYSCVEYGISAVKADGKGRTMLLNGSMFNPTWKP